MLYTFGHLGLNSDGGFYWFLLKITNLHNFILGIFLDIFLLIFFLDFSRFFEIILAKILIEESKLDLYISLLRNLNVNFVYITLEVFIIVFSFS